MGDLTRRALLAGFLSSLPVINLSASLEQRVNPPTIHTSEVDLEFRRFRDKVRSLEVKYINGGANPPIQFPYEDVGTRIGKELQEDYESIIGRFGMKLYGQSIFTFEDNVILTNGPRISDVIKIVLNEFRALVYVFDPSIPIIVFRTYQLDKKTLKVIDQEPPIQESLPLDYSNFYEIRDRIKLIRFTLEMVRNGQEDQIDKARHLVWERNRMGDDLLKYYGIYDSFSFPDMIDTAKYIDTPANYIRIYLFDRWTNATDNPSGGFLIISPNEARLTYPDPTSPTGYSVKPLIPVQRNKK